MKVWKLLPAGPMAPCSKPPLMQRLRLKLLPRHCSWFRASGRRHCELQGCQPTCCQGCRGCGCMTRTELCVSTTATQDVQEETVVHQWQRPSVGGWVLPVANSRTAFCCSGVMACKQSS